MTFQERTKLAMEELSKQPPVTLEEAREQVLRIKIRGSSKNKEENITNLLKIYHPEWTQEQINEEIIRLFSEFNEPL